MALNTTDNIHPRKAWTMRLNSVLKALPNFMCVLGGLVMLTAGCDYSVAGKWQYKEIKRVKSPDSQVEAVLVEGDAGATTSAVSKIYLVTVGDKRQFDERDDSNIFAADHLKGFNIIWKEPKLLEIHYEEARILGFRNFWFGRDIQNGRYVVELQLIATGTNSALPLKDRM